MCKVLCTHIHRQSERERERDEVKEKESLLYVCVFTVASSISHSIKNG